MKKSLLVLVLLLTSSVTYAKENAYTLSAAFVGMSMDYREYDDNDKILNSEKSNFKETVGGEFEFSYTKVLESKNYAKLGVNLLVLSGETEYVGAVLLANDSSQPYGSYVGTTNNSLFDAGIDYEFTHVLNYGFELSYGLGVGYRSWRRELSAYQVEVYSWLSVRPMIGAAYSMYDFTFATRAEYQYGLDPSMKILADYENPDTTVNLGSADILELSIPISYSINENFDIFTEYTYQYQTIEKSNLVPYILNGTDVTVYEPASKAYNQYVKFGMAFKF